MDAGFSGVNQGYLQEMRGDPVVVIAFPGAGAAVHLAEQQHIPPEIRGALVENHIIVDDHREMLVADVVIAGRLVVFKNGTVFQNFHDLTVFQMYFLFFKYIIPEFPLFFKC